MITNFSKFTSNSRAFLKRIGQVPGGFKKLFFETKDAVLLYSKKVTQNKPLSRKEEELIRSNYSSLQKVGLYFFLQAPPIIGIIPTVVYLRYPRQLLTRHFWNEEEYRAYMVEEFQESRVHANNLKNLITASSNDSQQLTKFHLPKQLDSLSDDHLKALAGANSICSTQFILKHSPSILLKMWLKTRAKEIAHDDVLLSLEGVHDLAPEDLQAACLRRGLNPCLNEGPDKLREYLTTWIQSHVSKHCRSTDQLPVSLLSHSTALPEIFLDEKTFTDYPAKEES